MAVLDVLEQLVDDLVGADLDASRASASSRALRSGRTLKPMIVALEVAASWMSFSVMPPTPRCTKASLTSSRSSLRRLSVSASSEPCTSAFTIRFSVAASPAWIWLKMSSSLAPPLMAWASRPMVGLALPVLAGRGDRARRSSRRGRRRSASPALGDVGQAEHLHRRGRAGLLDLLALVVDAAPGPGPRRRRRRAGRRPSACPAARGSWRRGHGRCRGWPRARRPWPGPSGLAVSSSSSATHEQLLEQVVDAEVLQGRDLDHDGVAAPRLGDEAVLGELLHAPGWGRRSPVDLVDRHDDRHLGRLGVVDAPRSSGA